MVKHIVPIVAIVCLLSLAGATEGQAQLKFGGYMQNWYINQQNEVANTRLEQGVSGFRTRRARLNAKTELNETFSVETWLEFAGKDNILLDFKGLAKISTGFNVTVGQFITPVQSYETSKLSSSNMLFYELSDVALALSNNMGHNSYRDIGVMVGGKFEIVTYAVYMGNGTGRFNNAGVEIANRAFGDGLMGGRVDVELVKGLTVGGHYGVNKQDSVAGTAYSPSPRSYDRNSYSGNVLLEGFGLPNLTAYATVCGGEVKESKTTYDGIVAAMGYKVISDLQLVARYDAYNSTVGAAVTQKRSNITVGGLYYFFKEKTELVRIGFDYVMREEQPTERKNNTIVLWTQFKF